MLGFMLSGYLTYSISNDQGLASYRYVMIC